MRSHFVNPVSLMSLEQRIVEFLGRKNYRPSRPRALARKLEIDEADYREFKKTLKRMVGQGRIVEDKSKALRLPDARPGRGKNAAGAVGAEAAASGTGGKRAAARQEPRPPKAGADRKPGFLKRPGFSKGVQNRKGAIAGIFRKTSGGFGFVRPHLGSTHITTDIFIPRHEVGDASTGDEVLVRVTERSAKPGLKFAGRIVEVIERATSIFVGLYLEEAERGYVRVDGTRFGEPIFVGDPGAKGAQPGDKVVFEMLRFPSPGWEGEGVITEVLGPRGGPGVDTMSIIREYNLPDAFPDDALEEARARAAQFNPEDLAGRLDLTKQLTVTIDPLDARDFDDAITLSRDERGHWHLGVHIADVSHFVRPQSALDREARTRGTSVYLPDRVLPMLPELISNGLASLQQGQVRYTKSTLLEFDPHGRRVDARLVNSAIKVTKRLTYEQAFAALEEPGKVHGKIPAKVRALLKQMRELALILRRRRAERGALELTMPEVKVDLNREGRVSGAHLVAHDISHQIIEEFMLAANEAVAEHLAELGLRFLRRVHPDPDPLKLKLFGEFATGLGFELDQPQSRYALQKLLAEAADRPEVYAVNYALLRSMQRAVYSPEEAGHYALASDCYCHFTSPIRRYPDLTVHRLLGQLFEKRRPRVEEEELVELGEHCTLTERRAEDAERDLVRVKLLLYLSDRIGMEMQAVITGVEDYGFFCQGKELPVEGLVHVSTLGDDFYFYESRSHSLAGRNTGRRYRLGDTVKVRVARVDVDRRQLDFRPVGRR